MSPIAKSRLTVLEEDGQSLGGVSICNAPIGKMRYAAIP